MGLESSYYFPHPFLSHWTFKMEGPALFVYFLGSFLTSYNQMLDGGSQQYYGGMTTVQPRSPDLEISEAAVHPHPISLAEQEGEKTRIISLPTPTTFKHMPRMEGELSQITQRDIKMMGLGANSEWFNLTLKDTIRRYQFTIGEFQWSDADGVSVTALGINNMVPCPTIVAREGEVIHINVTNRIPKPIFTSGKLQQYTNTSIHWHGLFQNGSPNHDGMGHVTQCPIKVGKSREYHFQLQQSGTYWYHSHIRSQYTEGLRGAFIIHPKEPKYSYDAFHVLALSDWYHHAMWVNEYLYMSPKSTGPPIPHSVLINGCGRYNCTVAAKDTWNSACDEKRQFRPVFRIRHDQTHVFHLVNAAAWSSFNFTIDGHELEVVEVEGSYLNKPQVVDGLLVSPSQRYAFIIRPKAEVKDGEEYLMRAYLRLDMLSQKPGPLNKFPNATYDQVTSLIRYTSTDFGDQAETKEPFSYREKIPPPPKKPADLRLFNQMDAPCGPPPPEKVDQEITLALRFDTGPDNVTHGNFDSKPFVLPQGPPVLYYMLENLTYPEGVQNHNLKLGDVVQIVINSHFGTHPIHLHGHNFHIMHEGPGDYDKNNPNHTLWKTGVTRDTALIQGGGHLVFRFVADNPGVWVMHCHIDWHLVGGMMVVFTEGADEARRRYNFTETDRQLCRDHGIPMPKLK